PGFRASNLGSKQSSSWARQMRSGDDPYLGGDATPRTPIATPEIIAVCQPWRLAAESPRRKDGNPLDGRALQMDTKERSLWFPRRQAPARILSKKISEERGGTVLVKTRAEISRLGGMNASVPPEPGWRDSQL